MMTTRLYTALALGLTFSAAFATASVQAALPQADALMIASDRARGGAIDGLIMESTVTAYDADKAGKSYQVRVYSNTDDSLVTFLAPQHSIGIKFLMQGRNMWLISRETSKPVPISPRQRLLGDASNGDVATTNYARDYSAVTVGEAQVNGEPCYELELTAKGSNTTYQRIRYFIAKDRHLALKAEYYTASGQHFKTAYFEYRSRLVTDKGSFPFVSKMQIFSELNKGQRTDLIYRDPQVAELPPSTFDMQALLADF
jgi:outer membrane lipoprotein-sorting protein